MTRKRENTAKTASTQLSTTNPTQSFHISNSYPLSRRRVRLLEGQPRDLKLNVCYNIKVILVSEAGGALRPTEGYTSWQDSLESWKGYC